MKFYYLNQKSVDFVEIKKIVIFIVFTVLFSSTIWVSHYYGVKKGRLSQITENDVVLLYYKSENNNFTRRNFYEYLKEINIKFPEIVFAQAMKESGFKSFLFRNNNNPFGMKEASKRAKTQDGSEYGHAYYQTWKHAAIDYALYQASIGVHKIKTEEDYLEFLQEMKYYDVDDPTNKSYLDDLKKISKNIDRYLED